MAVSNIKVFQTEIATATQEFLAQKSEALRDNSGGAFSISGDAYAGDFMTSSFYSHTMGDLDLIDVYAPNSDAEGEDIQQDEMTDVKLAGVTKEMKWTAMQLAWMQRQKGEAVVVVADGFSDNLIKMHVDSALAATIAAIKGQAALAVNDVSATDDISHSALNKAHALFGDSSSNLITEVMTGYTYHKLIGDAINNEQRLFAAGNIRVVEVLGRRFVVVDSPSLVDAGKQHVLSLSSGGIILDNVANVEIATRDTGKKVIEYGWRANFTYGLRIKGYSWDKATGGESPLLPVLKTSANWVRKAKDIKNTAGVLTIGNGAGL